MNRRNIGALCALLLVAMAGWPLAPSAQNTHSLPLVLPASNAALTGFVRIVNNSSRAGTVQVTAVDNSGARFAAVTLSLDAGETVNFNSRDLERGNASKGLPVGVGDGSGSWRLFLETALNITPLAYIRTSDGFVTSMHDAAPETAPGSRRYRVVFFNPGANTRQVSRLRLINPGSAAANVEITGRDDAGDPAPGGAVRLTLAPWSSRTLTAQALEAGTGLDGRLGDGSGKWRLTVSSNVALVAVSLLSSPTGHLANLSTAPEHRGVRPPEPEPPSGSNVVCCDYRYVLGTPRSECRCSRETYGSSPEEYCSGYSNPGLTEDVRVVDACPAYDACCDRPSIDDCVCGHVALGSACEATRGTLVDSCPARGQSGAASSSLLPNFGEPDNEPFFVGSARHQAAPRE